MGGSLYIQDVEGSFILLNNNFTQNRANKGGALYLNSGTDL